MSATFVPLFGKGNYKEIRKSLALIDRNDNMKNKTATECWNILIGERDSAMGLRLFFIVS